MIVIAGPCQHESLDHSLEIAEFCKNVCNEYNIDYYFKASFDKANRTSIHSTRASVPFGTWLKDFEEIQNNGFRTVTDVHESYQVNEVQDVVDVIQIPAFLCRQTDLIQAACKTGKIVNIKKGQFVSYEDAIHILEKTMRFNTKEVWLTERGTSFGYNRLIVDYVGLRYMLEKYQNSLSSWKIFFDATHSVQLPGGSSGKSGGQRHYAPFLAYAAASVGVQNFFFEVHDDPDNAPSDGPNMIHIDDFERIISKLFSDIVRNERYGI